MRRIERRLFQLNDEIAALRRDEELAREELIFHEHLNDDAQRDAIVSDSPIDRADARETGADVARFKRHIAKIEKTRLRLEAQRDRLIRKLG
ncbi:MAG TPA: hypothetical protein VLG28_06260 [Acidimicrobiia bacterium]|jgi:hypothetical protein|nr:hypothetical protein [Acidimicrobiia bacterium]